MLIPIISFKVVTKGPVAKAGLILKRFKVNGTNVPKKEAHKITTIKAELTVAANCQSSIKKAYDQIKLEQIRPLINPTPNSLNNLGVILSPNKVLLAKPCTIMELL